MSIIGILVLLVGLACLAGGAWLIFTGSVLIGIVLAILGLIILFSGHHTGQYGGPRHTL